jgi:hypothetical protein
MVPKDQETRTVMVPKPEVSARGTVRAGGGVITGGKLPELRLPPREVEGRGTVRSGGGVITGGKLPL